LAFRQIGLVPRPKRKNCVEKRKEEERGQRANIALPASQAQETHYPRMCFDNRIGKGEALLYVRNLVKKIEEGGFLLKRKRRFLLHAWRGDVGVLGSR